MIPQHIIDQILSETDIVQIVSEYLTLKKAGANFNACCPFHNEKSPSFVVSPQKQIYHCFGCGVGGNAIKFIMEYEKIEFPASIDILAERLNIEIPKNKSYANQESKTEPFYKINAYAHWFFKDQLKHSKKALQYIKDRLLSDEVVATYELGYGPDQYEALIPFLKSKNVPLDLVDKLGLIKKRERGGHYDFYRDRLMFPIRNTRGHIVGFGGRTLSDAQAKYINSSESPVYNKSKELYGLFEAKKEISTRDQAIVVEGYIDVIACAQLGLPHAVAPLGTALTEGQIKGLKRYTKNVVLMFDGDEAGQKAALKAIRLGFEAQIHPLMCPLPLGKDPGDFLNSNDSKELSNLVQNAVPAMSWLFSKLLSQVTSDPGQRAKITRKLCNWLKLLPDSLERREYTQKLCQYFEITPQDLEKILDNAKDLNILGRSNPEDLSLEARLVYHFVQDPSGFSDQLFSDLVNDFEDADIKLLSGKVLDFSKKHETFQPNVAISKLPPELQGLMRQILFKGSDLGIDAGMNDSVIRFKKQVNKKRLKRITAQILHAETLNDTNLKLELLQKKQELLRQSN